MTGVVILTPGENYREACLLLDQADAAEHRPGDRDWLLRAAAIRAQLARCGQQTYAQAEAAHAGVITTPGNPAMWPVAAPELTTRIDRALTALDGPAWPAVDCGPASAWADLADGVIRALTGPYYAHWADEHPGWPGGENSAPGADDVILVSAEDLRTVVAAVQADRYGAQDAAALEAAGRIAARMGGTS